MWPTGIIQNSLGGVYVKMPMLFTLYHFYIFSDDSWYSGLALSFGIRSKALMVEVIWQLNLFKNKRLKIEKHLEMAKLMTWGDSHWGAVHLQPNSRFPGRPNKPHCSNKDGENMIWIGSLFFLDIIALIYFLANSNWLSLSLPSARILTWLYSWKFIFPNLPTLGAVTIWKWWL